MNIRDLDGFFGEATLVSGETSERVTVRLRLVETRGFNTLHGAAEFAPAWAIAIQSGKHSVLRVPPVEIDVLVRTAGPEGVAFISSGAPRAIGRRA